ncbi:hypothetical protein BDP55DRAFT_632444 [Colletotrichum godetiae]|uniref:Uncharacterized protein n=1 Tax=Colletotrichum godetiae TaxID=1209918 RepID=A0AAJ0AL76_9PEZI|nr:uncharacterized protein BDP55DRAFT_632444 [Colletotrichum godetiae]KAK1675275.1 hypothetical protein BDP55DRAFT_632444 [Colletotrichum godetiae]
MSALHDGTVRFGGRGPLNFGGFAVLGLAKLRQRGRSNRGRAAMNMFGNGPREGGGGMPDLDSLTQAFDSGVLALVTVRNIDRRRRPHPSGFMMSEAGWQIKDVWQSGPGRVAVTPGFPSPASRRGQRSRERIRTRNAVNKRLAQLVNRAPMINPVRV